MVIQCLFVCEGSSDASLTTHIRQLLNIYGSHPADFNISIDGQRLVDKVRNGLDMASHYDLMFIHRDADRAGADARFREIAEAIRQSEYTDPWVGVVPVRMTEAWLLLDEAAIRRVVRRPNGSRPIALPSPSEVERRADPREILNSALLDASEARGRRRDDLRRNLPTLRRNLLQNLPIGGALEQLESWTRFRDDTVAALKRISD